MIVVNQGLMESLDQKATEETQDQVVRGVPKENRVFEAERDNQVNKTLNYSESQ